VALCWNDGAPDYNSYLTRSTRTLTGMPSGKIAKTARNNPPI